MIFEANHDFNLKSIGFLRVIENYLPQLS